MASAPKLIFVDDAEPGHPQVTLSGEALIPASQKRHIYVAVSDYEKCTKPLIHVRHYAAVIRKGDKDKKVVYQAKTKGITLFSDELSAVIKITESEKFKSMLQTTEKRKAEEEEEEDEEPKKKSKKKKKTKRVDSSDDSD